MLEACRDLKEKYQSMELGMTELRLLQESGLVSFENRGISRSNRDCLLCVVRFDRLVAFKDALCSLDFDSYEAYETFVKNAGFGLEKQTCSEEGYIVHSALKGFYEIACSIAENGKIDIEEEDIRLHECFNVYLRVQH